MDINNQPNKIDRLDEIQDGFEYLINEPNISIYEMMDNDFIRHNTDFDTLKSLFKAAGVRSEKDLETPNFKSFIKAHTRFNDWEEMLIQAGNQYAHRNLKNQALF
jgi:hypothetical protein